MMSSIWPSFWVFLEAACRKHSAYKHMHYIRHAVDPVPFQGVAHSGDEFVGGHLENSSIRPEQHKTTHFEWAWIGFT